MAQAARAYSSRYSTAPQRTPRRGAQPTPRPDVRVIPGSGVGHKTLSPALVHGFKIAVAIAVVLIAICSVRVWLSASTVQTLKNIETLETNIEKAYAAGSELEIEHSTLASPVRIQNEASKLGMGVPDKKIYLKVRTSPKIVTTANGEISLADTVLNIKDSNAVATK